MSFGLLSQVLVDLILFSGLAFVWMKLTRPQPDDPRLSRGLQLLQSKIAVLEDLSDQIETQVEQITGLMESKAREVQSLVVAADKQIRQIEVSMERSLEVAQIFQDRIPHQEIVDRKNTLKYVKAARLAHQGKSVDEIMDQVADLSRGEIELIAKVNKDQLQFSEEELPEWAKKELKIQSSPSSDPESGFYAASEHMPEIENRALSRMGDQPVMSLSNLGEKMRQSMGEKEGASAAMVETKKTEHSLIPKIEMPQSDPMRPQSSAASLRPKSVEVQRVVFPKINMNQHLS